MANESTRATQDPLARYAWIAAALFAGQALWAIGHLAMGGRYQGLTYLPADVTIDVTLAIAWTVAAVGAATRWKVLSLAPLVGCAASLSHGLMSSVSTPFSGVPFLIAGIAATYCVLRAMPSFTRALPKPVGLDAAGLRPRTPQWALLRPHR